MKKIVLLALAVILSCQFSYAQSEAEMKAMMEYGTPGGMHKMLEKENGEWEEVVTMWMAPGAEPMSFKATVTNEMVMDGRYQIQKHEGDMMGMPFRGVSTTGYDNARKVFINTWYDNFGTGIMYSEGKWDEKNQHIELKGKSTDPMTKKLIDMRQIVKHDDDDHQTVTMYMPHEGKEFKSMEIKLTRKK